MFGYISTSNTAILYSDRYCTPTDTDQFISMMYFLAPAVEKCQDSANFIIQSPCRGQSAISPRVPATSQPSVA